MSLTASDIKNRNMSSSIFAPYEPAQSTSVRGSKNYLSSDIFGTIIARNRIRIISKFTGLKSPVVAAHNHNDSKSTSVSTNNKTEVSNVTQSVSLHQTNYYLRCIRKKGILWGDIIQGTKKSHN